MSEVNKDRVRLLVDALKSGQFLQGNGCLEGVIGSPDLSAGLREHFAAQGRELPPGPIVTHCCLGVACRVAMANGLDVQANPTSNLPDFQTEFDGTTAYMPESVRAWFGFPPAFHSSDPVIGHNVHLKRDRPDLITMSASSMNDDGDFNFDQIADAFERTFLDA